MDILKEFAFLSEYPRFSHIRDHEDFVTFYFKAAPKNNDILHVEVLFIDVFRTFKETGVHSDEYLSLGHYDWFDQLFEQAKEHYRQLNRLRFIYSSDTQVQK